MKPFVRLNRSPLLSLLEQWGMAVPESAHKRDVAQRLSPWVKALEADRLNASLTAIEQCGPAFGVVDGLDDETQKTLKVLVQHEQAELAALIEHRVAQAMGAARPVGQRQPMSAKALKWMGAGGATAIDPGAPTRLYFSVQKTLDQRLVGLRQRVRQQLMEGPMRLRQLAALDGVMEQWMAPREQRLWPVLPNHLPLPDAADHPEPADRMAQAWQQAQTLLLTELNLRLEPIWGLVEAAQSAQSHPVVET